VGRQKDEEEEAGLLQLLLRPDWALVVALGVKGHTEEKQYAQEGE